MLRFFKPQKNSVILIVGFLFLYGMPLCIEIPQQNLDKADGVILIPKERSARQAWRMMLEEVERAFGGEWESAEGRVAAAGKAGANLVEFRYMETETPVGKGTQYVLGK